MKKLRKLRVIYWNNIPAPYMVERFNALADRGTLDFEAWFNDRIESGRSWVVDESSWRFPYRYMPSVAITGKRFHFPLPLFTSKKPDVLVSLYAEPSFLTGWLVASLRGSKTAFWCQVTRDSWVTRRPWKETFKRFIFPRVDRTLGSGQESRLFAMRYGVQPDNALILRHSIDVKHYAKGWKDAIPKRDRIREDLGLCGTTFIYVGRLWHGKGILYLLDAFANVQLRASKEISLLLIGDGEEEQALKNHCTQHNIKNVVFAGYKQKPELPRYYAAADVFVFPTLGDPYGLVVDEAMACSLPIISTSAAGEIQDRIEEGGNGYIVPPKNSVALAEAMCKFESDPTLCIRMGKVSAKKIDGHTPERWAKEFEAIARSLAQTT